MKQNTTRVQIINSTEKTVTKEGHRICFQWCRYLYGDGEIGYGYRFIWRDPKGRHMAHRGQARVESIQLLMELVGRAQKEGWGAYDGAELSQPAFGFIANPLPPELAAKVAKTLGQPNQPT